MLVDDDPKGNTVLCDAGAPYYDPAEYDYRGLTWQTLNTDSDEAPEGIDTGEPPAPEIPDAPPAPETPGNTAEGPVECPPPNARRIGDLNQAGTEKVTGYKLTPDGKICENTMGGTILYRTIPPIGSYCIYYCYYCCGCNVECPTCKTPSGFAFEGDKTCREEGFSQGR